MAHRESIIADLNPRDLSLKRAFESFEDIETVQDLLSQKYVKSCFYKNSGL